MYRNHIVLPIFSPCPPSQPVASLVTKLRSRVGASHHQRHHHHLLITSSTACNPRVRGATMSTAAISQQSQHLQQPEPELEPNTRNTPSHSSSVTAERPPSSSRQSTGQEARSMSKEQNQQSGAATRKSAFFPLGYKDAVYQWVTCTHLFSSQSNSRPLDTNY